MEKLSNYTHARYCTDETDVLVGLAEIKEAMRYRELIKKPIPRYYCIRKWKLEKKLKAVSTKGLRADEFKYRGHIFQAKRKFKPYEDFGYVGRRLTRLSIDGWDWDEFYSCANIIRHQNIALKDADIFLMDRDFLVVPCEGFLGKYEE